MQIQHLTIYHTTCLSEKREYYTELFSKAIWGDMGEDCASIHLQACEQGWLLHFIRTQSGEPYPLSDTVCNVIDEYEKLLSHEEVFDLLAMHRKLDEFEEMMNRYSNN